MKPALEQVQIHPLERQARSPLARPGPGRLPEGAVEDVASYLPTAHAHQAGHPEREPEAAVERHAASPAPARRPLLLWEACSEAATATIRDGCWEELFGWETPVAAAATPAEGAPVVGVVDVDAVVA
eukprot:CAMPEP_0206598098 /NCGR_PEP_ID=MMETSP0325_2-20121206/44463_1 /ASSEMBLY_ACC=CAM_ASM_000347 /TAXON_ID=2866 /ORGANISM="Crypthecodinium cohnii, Strain Seligo" /LENGTH=126 /DNA_ID=CAMNT_0054109077 /DNA_START=796 /DNA_END=1173 /DNA_ORIENTATION=-